MKPSSEDVTASLTFWSQLDLPTFKAALSSASTTLTTSRESSLASRRQLADDTKNFKKLNDANRQLGIKSLLKSYQAEIDSLTRRCKSSDARFIEVWKGLGDAPDPFVVMGGLKEMIEALESENASLKRTKTPPNASSSSSSLSSTDIDKLKKELAEYEYEFKNLKNQDITIRNLESTILHLQSTSSTSIDDQLSTLTKEIEDGADQRIFEANEREKDASIRVSSLERDLQNERARRSSLSSQLVDIKNSEYNSESALAVGRKLLVGDNDRLRERLSEIENERDTLLMRQGMVDGAGNGNGSSDRDGTGSARSSSPGVDFKQERQAFEAEVTELTMQVARMKEKSHANLIESKSLSIRHEDEISKVAASQKEGEKENERLKVKIDKQTVGKEEVDKMRKEIRVLKRIQFNVEDEEEDEEEDNEAEKEPDLETVLMSRLRRAESDLLTSKREHSEQTSFFERLNEQVVTEEAAKTKLVLLVQKLEEDLAKVLAEASSNYRASVSSPTKISNISNSINNNASTLQRILDPASASASGSEETIQSSFVNSSPIKDRQDSTNMSTDDSVILIIMSQRDRLKDRVDSLESERDAFKKELAIQVRSAESLQKDNGLMYEKVRYVTSMNASAANHNHSLNVSSGSAHTSANLDALEAKYETKQDPFKQFEREEKKRRYNNMGPIEKMVYSVAKIVLGNKEARTSLFFYVLGMHLLVFITSYHWTHESGCGALHSSLLEHPHATHMMHGVPNLDAPPPLSIIPLSDLSAKE